MAEDTNISPEMINNIINMLKNNTSNTGESDNNDTQNDTNFEDIISKISQNSNQNSSLDFETIMKIKSIIEAMNNQNNSDANLLYSLRPYLRKSKQAKLDQYVNLLKISQVTGLFKKEKGENK